MYSNAVYICPVGRKNWTLSRVHLFAGSNDLHDISNDPHAYDSPRAHILTFETRQYANKILYVTYFAYYLVSPIKTIVLMHASSCDWNVADSFYYIKLLCWFNGQFRIRFSFFHK